MTPSFLAITYSFFLSYMPYHNYSVDQNKVQRYTNATRVGYELGADLFDCVHFYTGENTNQYPVKFTSWCPYTQEYYLGMEYHKTFKEQLGIKIGIQHRCIHPVVSWGGASNDYNSGVTSVYLNVEGRLPVFRR